LAATGRLAASFGHEINNPLQTLGSLLYLLGQSTNLGEAERRHLTRAHAELEHVAHLTTSLLGFYRSSPSPAEVKICEVLDNVLKFYSPAIRSGKVIIEKRYDSEHDSWRSQRDNSGILQSCGECAGSFGSGRKAQVARFSLSRLEKPDKAWSPCSRC
jgi:signal transduction histidine kinase